MSVIVRGVDLSEHVLELGHIDLTQLDPKPLGLVEHHELHTAAEYQANLRARDEHLALVEAVTREVRERDKSRPGTPQWYYECERWPGPTAVTRTGPRAAIR